MDGRRVEESRTGPLGLAGPFSAGGARKSTLAPSVAPRPPRGSCGGLVAQLGALREFGDLKHDPYGTPGQEGGWSPRTWSPPGRGEVRSDRTRGGRGSVQIPVQSRSGHMSIVDNNLWRIIAASAGFGPLFPSTCHHGAITPVLNVVPKFFLELH